MKQNCRVARPFLACQSQKISRPPGIAQRSGCHGRRSLLDYPHSLCLWPNSASHIDRLTKNLAPLAKQKILAGNAVQLFNLR